jgi:acetyl-CoA carboxylase carboxyl transferase subunit beta
MAGEAAMSLPQSAGELAARLLDSFEPLDGQALTRDPLHWPGYPDAIARARKSTGEQQSVTAGRARAGGEPCLAIIFSFGFMGGSMGEAEGARITQAIDAAIAGRLPLVSVLRTGGARMQEGMRSLIQMQRVAHHLVRLREAGLPHVCLALHPTTGGVWASLGAGADVVLAEAGAAIAFAGARVRAWSDDPEPFTAEAKWRNGFVDAVLPPEQLAEQLALAVALLAPARRSAPALPPLPASSNGGAPAERGWAQVLRARDRDRPRGDAYLDGYLDRRLEIGGDRAGGRDPSVRCGFGSHDGVTIAFAVQTGGSTHASGYRTAARLVELADRLELPVITMIDSPGAVTGADAETEGVATAVSDLLRAVATARVPILSVAVG